MVAILVLLTFIGFIALDMVLHRHSVERAESPHRETNLRAVPIRAGRFPVPAPCTFVTANHLTAVLADNGMVVLRPDAVLTEAAGPGGAFTSALAGSHVRVGDPLYVLCSNRHALGVASPWDGRVVVGNGDSILFAPDNLAAAVREMRIGETMKSWWSAECDRLGMFLAGTGDLQGAMADGGEVRSGWIDALTRDEAVRFQTAFLDAKRH
jgi:hypothetical protein